MFGARAPAVQQHDIVTPMVFMSTCGIGIPCCAFAGVEDLDVATWFKLSLRGLTHACWRQPNRRHVIFEFVLSLSDFSRAPEE